MGFFRRIGRAISGVARRVTSGIGKVTSFISKPLSKLVEPFKGVLGKLGNLPVIGPLISKATSFLSKLGPLSSLLPGPFGMLAGIMSKVGSFAGLANTVGNVMQGFGGAGNVPAQGLKNITETTAFNHANLLQKLLGGVK